MKDEYSLTFVLYALMLRFKLKTLGLSKPRVFQSSL
jgi:hypothetical protein